MLTESQRQQWQRDGYLVLPGFKSAADVAAARARAWALVEAFEPGPQAAVFSTTDRQRIADAALIASANAVQCFLEAEALDDQGRLRVPKSLAVNKIGHALHERDPVFERFSHGPDLAELAADLGLVDPIAWQSMLIFKPPRIGGEVTWHQDATFLATEPHSVVGLWFALEDATETNGCLWVQPGGHRSPLRERYVQRHGRLQMEPLDATPWPGTQDAVPVPAAAGSLVMFDGLLPHYSAPNRSAQSRLAYTLHLTDGRAAWSPLNWLQRAPNDPPRGLL